MKKIMLFVVQSLFVCSCVYAADGQVQTTSQFPIPLLWWIAPIGSIIGLIAAYFCYKEMMLKSEGNETMKRIAGYVRVGAMAYLRQQYKVVALFFVAAFIMFAFMAFVLHVQAKLVPFAFITGGFFSGLSGFLGMKTATNASARTAYGASLSLDQGLKIAFRSGAVMGLVVVGLGLLDICIWFLILYKLAPVFNIHYTLNEITVTMLCFGMGASSQALFARVGGGIFTKAADVGADLVGKVEEGIPEDDPRNPATIADNVGDNVGDVAGMGADLYESYCGSILATAALGTAAFAGFTNQLNGIMLPMLIAGIGIIGSVLGVYAVRTKEGATQKSLLRSLLSGVIISSIIIVICSWFLVKWLVPDNFGIFWSMITGLLAGIIIGQSSEYYTSHDYSPTRHVAEHSKTGPATVIISGIGVGMLSTGVPVITTALGMLLSYGFAGGFTNPSLGLYGISIASVGMLSTLGITLATDAYGPIADNAGGNAEMSGLGAEVRKRTDALDALGNTTAATGKGFAIGSAALTALALLAAYIEEVRIGLERIGQQTIQVYDKIVAVTEHTAAITGNTLATLGDFMIYYNISLMNPKVLTGMFIGAMMSFVFCALAIQAVGRAAGKMVEEVRRQFKTKPGIMKGTELPDYSTCIQISTRGAQREMILPSLLAIIVPITIGILLGVPGVMGLLAGGTATGFVLALFLNNTGGSWDNAKKYIEGGVHGGKGSVCHKATVVGDTVGDPFKDTAGPALNILIKLMSMVSVVVAGVTVKYSIYIANFFGMK